METDYIQAPSLSIQTHLIRECHAGSCQQECSGFKARTWNVNECQHCRFSGEVCTWFANANPLKTIGRATGNCVELATTDGLILIQDA